MANRPPSNQELHLEMAQLEVLVRQTAARQNALVSALEAALADGGLFQATELQVKEALKMARGEG